MSVNSRRIRSDRGSVAIQMLFLMPTLFAVMFLGVQGALYYHAHEVALAAAQEGAREAAGQTGSRESGIAVAKTFLRDAGDEDVMTDTDVTGTRSATTATVTVTGTMLSVIPGCTDHHGRASRGDQSGHRGGRVRRSA